MPLTAAEQYLIELINRGRLDPLAEAERYGIDLNEGLSPDQIGTGPLQVLAHNETLSQASENHSVWMLDENTFDHTGENGSSAGGRMADAGYVFAGTWAWAENLAWAGTTGTVDMQASIAAHHEGLFLSSGHRSNTFAGHVREIGVAQIAGEYTLNGVAYNSSMLTENFALSGTDVFVTGVAYHDHDGDDFYSIGEGQSGLTFTANGAQGITADAGGYGVAVGAGGTTTVAVSDNGTTLATVQIDTSDGNAKLDVVTDANGDMALHVSTDTTLVSGIADATVLGSGNLDLRGSSAHNTLQGNGGDNRLTGLGGRDNLIGDGGADVLIGGGGKDKLWGGDDNDALTGGGGRDKLWGGNGDDALTGGGGRDVVRGGNGDDMIGGGGGRDKLFGGSGADTFIFTAGDDRIMDFDASVDQIEIDAQLLGNADIADLIGLDGDDIVIAFDNGHSLTIHDQSDMTLMLENITVA